MYKLEPQITKYIATGSYLSIITLNVNGLNAPTKRQRLAEWIKKQDPLYMLSTSDLLQNKVHIQTESEELEKNISCKWRPKKNAGVAILISDKIDFKTKAVKRDKEGYYIMIKGSIQEDITIINIYTSNIGAPHYVRQMLQV